MVKKLGHKKDILKVFDIDKWKTIKQVSKEIELSYQPVYTYLNQLAEEGFLKHKREGNVHLYTLNLKNNFVVKELENIEFEKSRNFMESNKKINLALTEFIEKIQKFSLWTVLLFGSTARKSRTTKSDIDIFIVNSKDEEEIKRIANTINMKYNLNISLIIVSLDEFRNMVVERNKFTQNLIDEKIVLYGFEFYFNELIKSMKKLKWI